MLSSRRNIKVDGVDCVPFSNLNDTSYPLIMKGGMRTVCVNWKKGGGYKKYVRHADLNRVVYNKDCHKMQ